MGFFRFISSVSGINAQVEIFKKTVGRTFSEVQVKDIARSWFDQLWWAFGVIGNKLFPNLKDKYFFGIFCINTLIILYSFLCINFILVYVSYKRIVNRLNNVNVVKVVEVVDSS